MRIGTMSVHEFLEKIGDLHGYPAPGLLIGGFMVEAARNALPEGTLFEAICESGKCLPDAVSMLSPCSLGNGRLSVVNLGRYALVLHDKYTGEGVRVYVDPKKLPAFPEIEAWFLKTKPKREQDSDKLLAEIEQAGDAVCSLERVVVPERVRRKSKMGEVGVCPGCGEAYPKADGPLCRGCMGEAPADPVRPDAPNLQAEPVEAAVGKSALHDMTRIIPGEEKGAAFLAGQTIAQDDVEALKKMGKNRVYTTETGAGPDWAHENEAALALATALSGPGVIFDPEPREGKVALKAGIDGLLVVDSERLVAFNMLPDVMAASRRGGALVEGDRPFAGVRALPLFIARDRLKAALDLLAAGPVFSVLPLKTASVAVLVTGTEVFEGRVTDRFIPVLEAKVAKLGGRVLASRLVPDNREAVAAAAQELVALGPDFLVTTAGMSVDPDDVTRFGLADAGLADVLFGTPILPGAMLLLGRIGNVRVVGLPACALHHRATAFDLIYPKLLAGLEPSRRELAGMAEGGFCLNCKTCTFPKCPFGK